MAKKTIKDKELELIETVKRFAAYVDVKTNTVGIYCTNEDMLKANKNLALKKLVKNHKYKIQTVIK